MCPMIVPASRGAKADAGFLIAILRGNIIRDKKILERIKALAIPPAYTEVWICAQPKGHIQATGLDERGRKQYRYHPKWREVRDEAKYARTLVFGRALPLIRQRTQSDLRKRMVCRARKCSRRLCNYWRKPRFASATKNMLKPTNPMA